MKSEVKIIFAFVCLVSCAQCVEDFPSRIERCKYEDEDCLIKQWNKQLIESYSSGIPELDLPITDAQHLDKVDIEIGSSLLKLKIGFRNITVLGLGRSIVGGMKGFKKDLKQMESFRITGLVPSASIIGNYEGSGKFLLLQVTGAGRGEIHLYNITFEVTVFTKANTVDGEDYLVPAKITVKYESEKSRFLFDNILNNKEISEGINKVVNDNDKLFAKEAYGPISKSFATIFKRALAPIFKKYPYRSFFLE